MRNRRGILERAALLLTFGSAWSGSAAAGERVTAEQAGESVVVAIDGDLFTVFRHGRDQRKPFFLPVVGPGGFDLLERAAPAAEETRAGRRVIVATEQAELVGNDGSREHAPRDLVLEAGIVEDNRVWIPQREAWIARRDVAPLAAVVTRPLSDRVQLGDRRSPHYYDHPHQKGLWLSVDEINRVKFWMEAGRIASEEVELVQKQDPVILRVVNRWLAPDDEPLLREETRVTLTADRLIVYDTTLSALAQTVEIGDTKEGMFAIRLPNSMREFISGGPVTNADGADSASAAWGRASRWVNYVGRIDDASFAVAIMDHPGNPWPSRYHVRDYGLFALNPFGEKAYTAGHSQPQPPRALSLQRDDSLRFRFAAWIHDGSDDAAALERIFADFASR